MSKRTPSYCFHKASGQAVVRIDGKDHYLGKYDSPESRAEYNRLIGEWFANGQCLPGRENEPGLTVNELLLAFWNHAERHYRRPDGTLTDEIHCLRAALRPLRQLYGHTPAKDFGPLALKAVRQKMVESVDRKTGLPWCRRSINLHTYRIRSVFKCGVENELIPSTVLLGLQAVRGLQKGRSTTRETEPVKPVPEAFVEAVLPAAPAPVRAMIQLQRLTGMRPGEVVIMRAIDLDTSGKVWLYRPGSDQGSNGAHKTAWRGHDRVIAIGPQAQEVIKEFLKPQVEAYLFSPADSMEAFIAQRRKNRKTRVQPCRAKPNRKVNPKRKWGQHYSVDSYRRAVERACEKAGVPCWHPHQLRHAAATEVRKEAGLDAARAVLGHRSPAITETYAEIDQAKAAAIMERIG